VACFIIERYISRYLSTYQNACVGTLNITLFTKPE